MDTVGAYEAKTHLPKLLARAQAVTAFDACYLELALRRGLPLGTNNEGLKAVAFS